MKKFIIFLAFTSCFTAAFTQYKYPATKTLDSSDTYFGVTYQDPYRWLENFKDTAVASWFKQQAQLSNSILNKISGRDELIAEWKMLDKLQPPQISSRNYENGKIFYRKTMPGENVSKLYYREGMNGKEQLLFDPTTYVKGKTLSIQGTLPSYDGKKIVIAYSESGAEISTIKVMDVATKTFMPETIYPSWFGPISWTFDNKAFTYFSQKTGDNTSPEFELNTKTRLHKLGDDVKNDIDFLSNESYPALDIKPNELPFAGLNKDSRDYIFGDLSNVRSEMFTYYAPASQLYSGKIDWKILCKPEDKIVRGREIIGNDIYAITYKDAKKYKLLHTSLLNPDWNSAETIAEEKPDETLESITHCKDYLFLIYSDGINNHIYKYNFKTKKTSDIALPYKGSAYIFCLDNKTNNCFAGLTSWNKPYTEYNFNAETNVFSPSQFNKAPVFPAAYKNLEVKEVEVEGHDGAMIPLSIIYKKGTKLDGKSVCLMDSYGAYGYSMAPYFNYLENALAIKGVVIAIPHVRGGSERGEEWYKAGYKTTKPNTWKDFNSCAEYLIQKGYTSADRLAGTGTSAGGILISRAITERPDLYAAAICNVGCANAMRMEFAPNGPANIPEFGTVKDSIECKALYEMDGVQHVVGSTKYPAVICIGGWNDPRVIAWEPGKFAAALQNATNSGKPVIMKVNYDNGHFTEDKSVTFANFADQFAFAMWQCGHPDFQLKK
ncbi:MAG: prolyl oligopeptidase family serine peptidase [Ginsengibacter sp.]